MNVEVDNPNSNNPVVDSGNRFLGPWQRWLTTLFLALKTVDGGTP
jgi:hypothetical protein